MRGVSEYCSEHYHSEQACAVAGEALAVKGLGQLKNVLLRKRTAVELRKVSIRSGDRVPFLTEHYFLTERF
jgi:hypothetical protein